MAFDLLRKYKKIFKKKIDIFILSTEKNPVVKMRAKKLKIDCFQGVEDKLGFIKNYLLKKSSSNIYNEEGIIYLGNDLNDYSSMKLSGFSVAPNDAHPEIKKIANVVMEANGGEGFVRSFVEELFSENKIEINNLI